MVYPLSEKVAGTTSATKAPRPGNTTLSLSRISSLTILDSKSISMIKFFILANINNITSKSITKRQNVKKVIKFSAKSLEGKKKFIPLQSQTKTQRLKSNSRIAQLVRASDC